MVGIFHFSEEKAVKIVVLVKQTPDTETKIVLGDGGQSLNDSHFKYIINPYDEFAIEEAVKIKEAKKASEVIVLSAGPKRVQESMRKAMAMGADRGIWITGVVLTVLWTL